MLCLYVHQWVLLHQNLGLKTGSNSAEEGKSPPAGEEQLPRNQKMLEANQPENWKHL